MNALLAIEQSGREASVAIRFNDGSVNRKTAMRFFSGQRGVTLLPEIDLLLKEAGITQQQLTAVLVGVGPGSYTGLRIACSAARTLSFALDIPCAGVVGFQAKMLEAPIGAKVHFVLDAYRKEIYHAVYQRMEDSIQVVSAPKILPQSDCDQVVPSGESFFGDLTLFSDPELFAKTRVCLNASTHPNAAQIIDLALLSEASLSGEGLDTFSAATPLYLRAAAFRPQAKA